MLAVIQIIAIAVAVSALLIGLWILFPGLRDAAERSSLDRLEGEAREKTLRGLAARHGLQLSHLPEDEQVAEVKRAVAAKMPPMFMKWAVTEVFFIAGAVVATITFVAPEWLGFPPTGK